MQFKVVQHVVALVQNDGSLKEQHQFLHAALKALMKFEEQANRKMMKLDARSIILQYYQYIDTLACLPLLKHVLTAEWLAEGPNQEFYEDNNLQQSLTEGKILCL